MKVKGSYTIEASFLVPFAIALMLLVGTTALWLYDKDVTWFNAVLIAEEAESQVRLDSKHAKTNNTAYGNSHGTDALLGDVSMTTAVKTKSYKVTVKNNGSVNLPFSAWFAELGWPVYGDLSASKSEVVLKPCEVIRAYRWIKSVKE